MKYLVKWTATVRGEMEVEADYADAAEDAVAMKVVTAGAWRDVENADVSAYVGKGPGVHMSPLERDLTDVVKEAAEAEGGPPYDAATATGMYDHDDEN